MADAGRCAREVDDAPTGPRKRAGWGLALGGGGELDVELFGVFWMVALSFMMEQRTSGRAEIGGISRMHLRGRWRYSERGAQMTTAERRVTDGAGRLLRTPPGDRRRLGAASRRQLGGYADVPLDELGPRSKQCLAAFVATLRTGDTRAVCAGLAGARCGGAGAGYHESEIDQLVCACRMAASPFILREYI